MDLIELVSPHVAVPVIGVVVCAFMVFAFGFRSPVQPPSFEFEEKKSKRRTKQSTKLKGPVSGDIVTAEITLEVGQKSTPKPVKEIKPALSPKAKSKEPKVEARKELRQDLKGEKKVKARKEGVKEEVAAENVKKVKAVLAKKETEEDGEWTTIQVTKKGKKQKPINKREGGRAESAVESENEPEATPVSEAAAASSAHGSEFDEPSSPEVSRARNKKKLGKLPEKNKAEDKTKPAVVPVVIVPVYAVSVTPHAEDQADGKRKKNKREKKMSGEAAASAHENLPQDAAPASGQSVNKERSTSVAPASGQVVEKDQSPAVAPASGQVIKKEPSPVVAPASGHAVNKDPSSVVEALTSQQVTKKQSSPAVAPASEQISKKQPSPAVAPASEQISKKQPSPAVAPASEQISKKQPSPAVAPASEQISKKQPSPAVAPASEQISKKQPSPAVTPASEQISKKQPSPAVAPTSEQISKKQPSPAVAPTSEQDLVNIEQAKPSLKKKKTAGKESIQKTSEKVTNDQIKPLEKPADSVKKSENKLTDAISEAARLEPSDSPAPPDSLPQQSNPVSGGQSPAGISFDEIGDSWQEATPKSKKKKPRRDN